MVDVANVEPFVGRNGSVALSLIGAPTHSLLSLVSIARLLAGTYFHSNSRG